MAIFQHLSLYPFPTEKPAQLEAEEKEVYKLE